MTDSPPKVEATVLEDNTLTFCPQKDHFNAPQNIVSSRLLLQLAHWLFNVPSSLPVPVVKSCYNVQQFRKSGTRHNISYESYHSVLRSVSFLVSIDVDVCLGEFRFACVCLRQFRSGCFCLRQFRFACLPSSKVTPAVETSVNPGDGVRREVVK